jgi:hypothetical protein
MADPLFTGKNYTSALKRNILHSYRSWVYNFSFGAVPPTELTTEDSVRKAIKKYNVLTSSGKGTQGMQVSGDAASLPGDVSSLVDEYNKLSPGHFDMYIDDVEIQSVITAGTPSTGSSQACNVKFSVYEPYSINGFIEALQVAAQASGYTDYIKATFALEFTFQGYPDDQPVESSVPQEVPFSSRYYIITITGIEADINENGTKYRVDAVPMTHTGFGNPNNLLFDIKVAGDSVKEILSNFFNGINESLRANAVKSKSLTDSEAGVKYDTYELSVPDIVAPGGTAQDTTQALICSKDDGPIKTPKNLFQHRVLSSPMNKVLESKNVFQMGDPKQFAKGYVATGTKDSSSKPTSDKISLTNGTVVFSAGSKIHDCIMAVIRDSEWVSQHIMAGTLAGSDLVDAYGMFTYFTVRLETSYGDFDKVQNRYLFNYRFILEPYKMHYTRIPGNEQGTFNPSAIKDTLQRSYNYIYTGKNLDIVKFNLKFDNLYFSGTPANAGNRPAENPTTHSAKPNGDVENKHPNSAFGQDPAAFKSMSPVAPRSTDASQSQRPETVAGQIQNTPYQRLASNMHKAILGGAELITGKLDIFGDPYYLTTGGTLSRNLKVKEAYLTANGEAEVTQTALYINIDFRNPVDINTTGFLEFSKQTPFSGIYQVTMVNSLFKDGLFTQSLDVLRLPGQVLDGSTAVIANDNKSVAEPDAATVKNSAGATVVDTGPKTNAAGLASLGPSVNSAADAFTTPSSVAIPTLPTGIPTLPTGIPTLSATPLASASAALSSGATNLVSGATNVIAGAAKQLPSLTSAASSLAAKATSAVTPAIAQFKSIDFAAIEATAKQGLDLSILKPTPGSGETLSDLLKKIPPAQPFSLPPLPPLDPSLALSIKASADTLKSAIPSISVPKFGDNLTGLANNAVSGVANLTSNLPSAAGTVAKFI